MKTAIDAFKHEDGAPETITVFAGDTFGALFGNRNKIREATSKLIVDSLPILGVDAFTVGEQELVVDYELFLSMIATSQVPFVCANLELENVKPYIVVNRSGKKVLITAALDPQLLSDVTSKSFQLSDPLAAIKHTLETVEHDISIVVFHFDTQEFSRLLDPLPNVDVALMGHSGLFGCNQETTDPTAHHQTIIAGNNTGGQNMAYMDVDISGDSPILTGNEVVHLGNEVEADPAVYALVDEREKVFTTAIKAKEEFGRLKNFMNMKAYVGVDWCLPCHQEIVESWDQTTHATAFVTLEGERRHEDINCVGCHVVGFMSNDAANGFVKGAITPEFKNVQCEACHGPASDHLLDTEQPYGHVSETTCRSCHTSEWDPSFAFEDDKLRGTHVIP